MKQMRSLEFKKKDDTQLWLMLLMLCTEYLGVRKSYQAGLGSGWGQEVTDYNIRSLTGVYIRVQ